MDSTRIACPICGWWRTLDFGIDASGTPREVRFDKVNPATSLLLRIERLQGHGREAGKSEIRLIDAQGILGLDPKYLHQIRTQCHRILDVIEGRTEAKPETFEPTPAKVIVKIEPKKKEVTKKKKATAEKKEKPAPPAEKPKRQKAPEPESMGLFDTYPEREDADIDLAKMKRLSPEFIWRSIEAKGPKNKTVYQLWYYAEVKPEKEKPAPAKKAVPKAKAPVTKKKTSKKAKK